MRLSWASQCFEYLDRLRALIERGQRRFMVYAGCGGCAKWKDSEPAAWFVQSAGFRVPENRQSVYPSTGQDGNSGGGPRRVDRVSRSP